MRPPESSHSEPPLFDDNEAQQHAAGIGDGTIIDVAARRGRLSRQQLLRQRRARSRWRDKAMRADEELSPAEREQLEMERAIREHERQEALQAREAARLRRCPPAHWGLTAVTLLLTILSVPFIYSAAAAVALAKNKSADYFLVRQLIFVVAGLGVMYLASRIHPSRLAGWMKFLYGAAIVGLILTRFSPLGVRDGEGIRRWMSLGPLGTFQVSELAKIALVGMVALYWSRLSLRERRGLEPWLMGWAIALPLIGLVFLQPHLSAAALLFVLPCAVAFFAGAPLNRIFQVGGSLAGLAAVVVALCIVGKAPLLKDYQQERIRAFVVRHAETDAAKKKDYKDANYQAEQGMNALQRGGLLGAGPGASLYKHGHVPEPHTDFILAVIGEEWGLTGTLLLLCGFGAMIFFCFQIGHNAVTSFEALFCAGVGTLLAIQVVANTGVVTGLLPVTGVVLPLLSYGGSNLAVILFAIGVVLGISRRQGEIE